MQCNSQQWRIPGVGELSPRIDRVVIVSPTPVGVLKSKRPIQLLGEAAHSFDVTTYNGANPKLRSAITVVCALDPAPLHILAQHEALLGRYSIVNVEIALDLSSAAGDVQETLLASVAQMGKYRHTRRQLRAIYQPDKAPPRGCLAGPTFYFENRKSGVSLKAYARHRKLPDRAFGGEHVVRLEWTLSRKPALMRHLGGNQLAHILACDLNAFAQRNLRLERVNHLAVGYLVRGIRRSRGRHRQTAAGAEGTRPWWRRYHDPDYRAWRAAHLVLRRLAYRDEEKFGDWDLALWTCQNSPAHIRGYLRELRDARRARRRGRPRKPRLGVAEITDYLIDKCFEQVVLLPG